MRLRNTVISEVFLIVIGGLIGFQFEIRNGIHASGVHKKTIAADTAASAYPKWIFTNVTVYDCGGLNLQNSYQAQETGSSPVAASLTFNTNSVNKCPLKSTEFQTTTSPGIYNWNQLDRPPGLAIYLFKKVDGDDNFGSTSISDCKPPAAVGCPSLGENMQIALGAGASIRTILHELGHARNLCHYQARFNLMLQDVDGGAKLFPCQASSAKPETNCKNCADPVLPPATETSTIGARWLKSRCRVGSANWLRVIASQQKKSEIEIIESFYRSGSTAYEEGFIRRTVEALSWSGGEPSLKLLHEIQVATSRRARSGILEAIRVICNRLDFKPTECKSVITSPDRGQ